YDHGFFNSLLRATSASTQACSGLIESAGRVSIGGKRCKQESPRTVDNGSSAEDVQPPSSTVAPSATRTTPSQGNRPEDLINSSPPKAGKCRITPPAFTTAEQREAVPRACTLSTR